MEFAKRALRQFFFIKDTVGATMQAVSLVNKAIQLLEIMVTMLALICRIFDYNPTYRGIRQIGNVPPLIYSGYSGYSTAVHAIRTILPLRHSNRTEPRPHSYIKQMRMCTPQEKIAILLAHLPRHPGSEGHRPVSHGAGILHVDPQPGIIPYHQQLSIFPRNHYGSV